MINAILLGEIITLAEMIGLAIITIGLLVLDGRIVNKILKLNRNIDKLQPFFRQITIFRFKYI